MTIRKRRNGVPVFTSLQYDAVAKVISSIWYDRDAISEKFAEMFKADNPKFKPEKFYKACSAKTPASFSNTTFYRLLHDDIFVEAEGREDVLSDEEVLDVAKLYDKLSHERPSEDIDSLIEIVVSERGHEE